MIQSETIAKPDIPDADSEVPILEDPTPSAALFQMPPALSRNTTASPITVRWKLSERRNRKLKQTD